MFHKVTDKITDLTKDIKNIASEIKDSAGKTLRGTRNEMSDLRRKAMKKVNFKMSLKIHLTTFAFGNILLFAINILTTPAYLWAFYSLIGWSLGYLLHFLGYYVFTGIKGSSFKKSVIFHGIVYATVIPYLVVENLFQSGTVFWSIYAIIFWGFGLIIHAAVYAFVGSSKENAILKEIQRLKARIPNEKEQSPPMEAVH